jgi:predicted outer membrane repeat protein
LPDCTYTPDPDYNGPDSFSFRVSDGYQESENGKVDIIVNPLNDPPTITGATLLTDEDQKSVGFTPWVVDADNVDSYTYSILDQPFKGTAYITLNKLVYDPEPDYNGNDYFTFRTWDSGGEYVDGTAIVTINPVNDPPTSTSASITTGENATSAGVTPTVLDIDSGESFTFSILTQPSSGAAAVSLDQLFYTPNPGITGSDSFTYRAFDSGNEQVDGTASVTIVAADDLPVANSQSVTPDEDVALPITLTASYSGGGGLTWTIISQPSHGALSGTPPNVSYLSTLNYNGADSFTFQVNDGVHNSNIATVDITVNPVNDAPTSTSASITTDEDTPSAGVTPTVLDVDSGESFTFTILTQPSSGAVSVSLDQLFYTPNPDIFGSDSFTYRAIDSGNENVDGTASVTIVAVNDAPVAQSQSVIADEDIAKPILLTAVDVDGDELTYTIVSAPSYGSLTGTPPNVAYLSNAGYFGPDSFSFMVNDGSVDSAAATVRLIVIPATDIWFVDIDAVGTADGLSWPNAFNHPQDALDMAGNSDEIWVADGVYVQRAATDGYVITMVESVKLYGGFSGGETSLSERDIEANPTVLDGENTMMVVYGADNARIDGFTITRALQNGMVNDGVSPIITDCIFVNNGLVQGLDGGAIQNLSNADAYIASTTFISNNGSAIYNSGSSPTIINCDFITNLSESGGAIKNEGQTAQPLISKSFFGGNTASINGGAISNIASNPLIENCTFSANVAGANGGAISNENGAVPNIINSLFSDNTAAKSGGAIFNLESGPTLLNSTISHNYAESFGGGIFSEDAKGKGKEPMIINSILWSNSDVQISGKAKVEFSNIQEKTKGRGNIDQDPAFMDTTVRDYRLSGGSPCIDAGNNDVVSTSLDLADGPRIADGNGDGSAIVDMGAYEYAP